MSCLPFCGLRLWGRKRAISSPPNVVHEDDAEQPRPYSGSTAVGTSTSADTGSEEKVNEKDNEPEKRSRSRSVSQRLVVPVGAFTSALRERARSRSRSKSLLPPTKPSEDDEKELPSLPSSNDKPPRLSLDDQEKEPRLSSSDEKPHPAKDVDEKPPRLELNLVTVTGPAWPLKDDKDAEGSNAPKQPDSAKQRVNSFGSLDTPTSPDFPDEEKKHVVERLSITKGDPNRDSKLEDENPEVETMEETEEEARKRKMRESRQRLAMEQPKDEQDRLDMFQCM